MIENALVAGFTSVGMDVLLLGPMPTPAVAMLTRSLRADLGVMISASHNPYEDNGIKLFGPDGFKLSDEIEREIEALIDTDLGRAPRRLAATSAAPSASRACTPATSSSPSAPCRARSTSTGLRVVVDCANGAAYKVAPEALWELGAEVIAIGVEPDGFNINRDVGSTAPEALSRKVRELRADIGIALDGDADRVVIVDEKGQRGRRRPADGAWSRASWRDDGRLTQPGIVATVMSNLGLERYLGDLGLDLARTAVGDRYVLEHMREHGYNVGGEQSGHIILSDYATTGDGLVAALQVLAVRQAQGRAGERGLPLLRAAAADPEERPLPAGQAARAGRRWSRRSRRRACGSAPAGGWSSGPSGTEPVIRVMAEGDDRDLVQRVVDDVVEALKAVAA